VDLEHSLWLTLSFVVLAILLVLLNAFFVASEFAIVKVRQTRLRELDAQGVKGAKAGLRLLERLDDYLSATQLGITLVSLALGWIGEESFYRLLYFMAPETAAANPAAFHAISLGISFFIITLLHVVLGELIPKSMAIQQAERVTLVIATPLHFFFKLAKPLILIFTAAANVVLRAMGYVGFEEAPWTEEELKLVMKDSREDGVITDSEAQIIHRAFSFADKKAKDIMIPIEEVQYISLARSFEENKRTVQSRMHTRFPLCRTDMKDVLGVINMKDLRFIEEWDNDAFEEKKKAPLFITTEHRQDRLMKLFSETRVHMAIVQDPVTLENLGIVTLEDVLEELVGDIVDEHGN
jgi:CBS domain containing-hemolysin-like protein